MEKVFISGNQYAITSVIDNEYAELENIYGVSGGKFDD